MMTKAELVSVIAEKTGTTKRQTQEMIDAFTDAIADAFAKGETVRLVGFGTFEPKKRAARTYINPQTGEKIKRGATLVPTFHAGSKLKTATASAAGSKTHSKVKK